MDAPGTRKNPYVGPRAFEQGETLYGRDQDILNLYYLLLSERIVLLFSPSGAGKSSLVQAGLIPKLEEKFARLPVIRVNLEPPQDLVNKEGFNRYIFSALLSLEEGVPDAERIPAGALAGMTLHDYLARRHHPEAAQGPRGEEDEGEDDQNRAAYEILIFDQFEEILTVAPNDLESKRVFFEQVGEALHDQKLWALFVAREDYVAAFDPYLRLVPTRLASRYRLDLLNQSMARQAIQQPARAAGVEFTDAAAGKLVKDLSEVRVQRPDGTTVPEPGSYVEPVQLQVVCFSLWGKLPPTATEISEDLIEEIGEVDESLAAYYSDTICAAEEQFNVSQRAIRQWFDTRLITSQGGRNQVMKEAERSGGLENGVIDFFKNAYLVRAEQRLGSTWYELAHDRLIAPIVGSNKGWFDENLSPLQKQAALWNDQKRNANWLLGDQALSEVEEWAVAHPDDVGELEAEFLEACRENQTERRAEQEHEEQRKELEAATKLMGVQARLMEVRARSARRAWLLSLVALALMIIAVVASLFAYSQRNQAERARETAVAAQSTAKADANSAEVSAERARAKAAEARSHELAGIAADQLVGQPDLAILLGIEAYKTDPNPQTQGTLLSILEQSSSIQRFRYLKGLTEIKASPDGNRIAVLDQAGVTLLDGAGDTIGGPFLGPLSPIASTAFSPDGSILAASSKDGSILFWDVQSRQQLGEALTDHTQWANDVAFSSDGKTLVSSSDDGSAILWDLTSPDHPQKKGAPIVHDSGVNDALLNPKRQNMLAVYAGGIVLWDISNPDDPKKVSVAREGGDTIIRMAFSPNGEILAAGDLSGTLELWDTSQEMKAIHIAAENTGVGIWSVAFDPGGGKLATGNTDGSVSLWDVSNPEAPRSLRDPLPLHTESVSSLSFSPDGKTLASAGRDGEVVLSESATGRELSRWSSGTLDPRGFPSPVNSVSFSPDGKTLAIGVEDGSITLLDISNPRKPVQTGEKLQGHPSQLLPEQVEFSTNGTILTLSKQIPGFPLDNYTAGLLVDAVSGKPLGPGRIEFEDPAGEFLVARVYDSTQNRYSTEVLDATTGRIIGKPMPIPGDFRSAIAGPSLLAYQTTDEDGKTFIQLWDFDTRGKVGEIEGKLLGVSPDGKYLAYSTESDTGSQRIIIRALATGSDLPSPVDGDFIAFSSAGNLVYSSTNRRGDSTIAVFDRESGKPIGQPVVGSVPDVSPDHQRLLYQTQDEAGNTVFRLMDLGAGSSFEGSIPGDYYSPPIFSPDGSVVISQAYDPGSGATNFAFRLSADGSLFGPTISGSQIDRIIQRGHLLILQIRANDGAKVVVLDTDTHQQIGETIGGELQSIIEDGRTLIYHDAAGIEQMDMVSGATSNLAGAYTGIVSAGRKLLLPHGDTLQIMDLGQGPTLGELVPNGDLGESVQTAALSPDGKALAVFSAGEISLRDPLTGTGLVAPFNDHRGAIAFSGNIPAFGPDGKMLAMGDFATETTKLWDVSTQKQIGGDLPGDFPAFSPDGKTLALGNYNNDTTTLWDVSTKQRFGDDRSGSFPAFSPDGTTLAVGDFNTSTTTLWDLNTGQQIGDGFPGIFAAFSPDGKTLAVGDFSSETTTLWDLSTDQQIGDAVPGSFPAFSLDGQTLALGSYNTETTSLGSVSKRQQTGIELPGIFAAFSPDGKTLAVGNFSDNSATLWEWDAQTNTASRKIGVSKGNVTALRFSPDSRILASIGEDGIVLSQAASGQKISGPVPGQDVAFSPDGKTMAISADHSISFWDIATGKQLALSLQGTGATFSPDGSVIATTDTGKGTVAFWSFSTAEQLNTSPIRGNAVQFSPDGKEAAITDGAAVYLWDIASQKTKGNPVTIPSGVTKLAFAGAGQFLLVEDSAANTTILDLASLAPVGVPVQGTMQLGGSYPGANTGTFLFSKDGKLYLWQFDSQDWIDELCLKVGRNLTQDEWAQYFADEPTYHATCGQGSPGPQPTPAPSPTP